MAYFKIAVISVLFLINLGFGIKDRGAWLNWFAAGALFIAMIDAITGEPLL